MDQEQNSILFWVRDDIEQIVLISVDLEVDVPAALSARRIFLVPEKTKNVDWVLWHRFQPMP